MVIDTSAMIAIILGEPERQAFSTAILADGTRIAGVATVFEASMVMTGRSGDAGPEEVRRFIRRLQVETVPFTAEQLDHAQEAFRRFGKGRHPAALNFGDCMSYALAMATGEPLLFKGNDFARTDIRPAI